jgi:hypothetical protein
LLLILLALVVSSVGAVAQTPDAPVDTSRTVAASDTLSGDSLRVTSRSGMDTLVTYSARDSIVFDIQSKKMILYGDAIVIKGATKLTAAYIEIDFQKSELYAEGRYDSAARKAYGVPVFNDGSQEFSASTIRYNFRTKKGTLSAAETAFNEGFYFAEKTKRVDENTLFAQNGRYTTCDATHPHFYFSSPEMKIVVGEKVFADQVTLNVADVPILYLPFGIFFPSHNGRQSGLIIPRPSQNAQRGFTLEGLGYYWAGNDYMDSRFDADLYSKGGYTIRNYSRFRVRGIVETGDVNTTFGRTRSDPDNPLEPSFILGINFAAGQQLLAGIPLIGRKAALGGNLNFSSNNAIRNTSSGYSDINRLRDITTQLITSNFSYSTSFDWGGSLTAQYNRTQYIITDELHETFPSISLSLPTWTPFANATGGIGSALQSLSLGVGLSGQRRYDRSDTLPGGARIIDTHQSIDYSPSISLSPKLGYFSFTPSISLTNGHIFFRQIHKRAVGDTVISTETPGVFSTLGASFGAGLSTTLYGIIQPRVRVFGIGLNAIRHVLKPSIGFSYTPDLGSRYYDQFFNPITNRVESYSIFERDGSVPINRVSENFTFRLSNDLEAKIAQGDTLEDKKIRLLHVDLSTAYDAAPDAQFRWSDLSLSANTDLASVGSIYASATFSPYAIDTLGNAIPHTLYTRGEGFLRATSASINFSTSFSDQGFNTGPAPVATVPDSAGARRERFNFETSEFDQREFFGERVQGTPEFRIPWQISLSGNYTLSPSRERGRIGEFDSFFSIRTDFSFSLTPTTRISSGATYNLKEGKFVIPTIDFAKDLHCWEMLFSWQPIGTYRGFRFDLHIKAPQLQDLKLQRQEVFYQ